MSDISIPGVSSRFNTEKMVEELVEAESVRLDRMKSELETFQEEKKAWQEMNLGMSNLGNSSKTLFSFENPFNERNALSENEGVIRAQATREASEGVTEIVVLQTARADRFISDDLDRELDIPKGIYSFTIGDDSLRLRFRGGSVKEFSQALNRRDAELIRSSVVNNRPGSQVMLIESMREGSANPMGFQDDARTLALQLGWVEETTDGNVGIAMETAQIREWTKNLDNQAFSRQGEILKIGPEAEFSLPFPVAVDVNDSMVLRYEVRLITNEDYRNKPPATPPGPDTPSTGSVNLRDITIPNFPSHIDLPKTEVPPAPPIVEESQLLYVTDGNNSAPLPDVRENLNFVQVEIPLADISNRIDAINVRNPNSIKDLELRNIEIVDTEARGDLRPKNAIDSARDALLEVEGIRIERESNSIDDIIPGVTLELRRESDELVKINVEPDRELVKENLIEWVARYNQIIRDINILTRSNTDIIDEIEYFSDEEREKYTERLGMFQGDSTLNTLKSRLQNITMSQYDTNLGRDLALLAQVGISTNASQGGGGVNVNRFRGYLEINEEVLDTALSNNFLAVKELFGSDSDGDLLTDKGVAYEMDSLVQPFVEIGGILSSKTSRYDRIISSQNDDISDYEEHLEEYEAEQRRQFGTMEAAINSLESQTQGLNALNNQNNNN